MIPKNDRNRTYSAVYLPKVEGLHKVKRTHDTLIMKPSHASFMAAAALQLLQAPELL